MYSFKISKRRQYEFEGKLKGEFSEESLRLIGHTDTDEVVLGGEVGCEWDDDIPMTFVDGEIVAKSADGEWVDADKFLDSISARGLVEGAVEDLAEDFYSDYESDRSAAAADFRCEDR